MLFFIKQTWFSEIHGFKHMSESQIHKSRDFQEKFPYFSKGAGHGVPTMISLAAK